MHFYKVEPKEKVGVITVQCIEIDKGITDVEVTYEYIGLSESGNQFIEGFTSTQYKEFIGEWKDLLLIYFQSECIQPTTKSVNPIVALLFASADAWRYV